jgi:type I restriction enzyme S subunit
MGSEWEEVPLKELAITNRENYSKKDGWEYVYYLDTANITKCIIGDITCLDLENDKLPSRARRKIAINDIVYSTVRPNQEHYGIIREPVSNMLVSTGFVTITVKEGVEASYLYYFISQPQITAYFHAIAEQRVSTYPALNVSDIENLTVAVPPLPTQKVIANTLSCLDAKIEVNNKIIKNLEEQAQAIFKSWFVDFEPFQNGEFVDSELGMIPKGWKLLKFEDFIIPRNERDNNPEVSTYSVTNTGIHLRENIFKKRLSYSKTKNKVLYRGDLVFGMSRDILNWGVMKDEVGEVSSAYHVYEINQKVIESWYLELFMTQQIHCFSNLIRPASREGQGIDRGLLPTKQVYIPPIDWVNHYFNIWASIKDMQKSYAQQNTTLAALRDALLPKLMSGKIEVPADS